MKLFVGNLSADVSPGMIQSMFEAYGTVSSVSLAKENSTDKYMAQVEMPNDSEASNAIMHIDGNTIGGSSVIIKNKKELIEPTANVANIEYSEQVQDKSSTIAKMDDAIDIHEYARMTMDNRRDQKMDRRKDQSPLFKKEKGIVIDRRLMEDRRDSIEKN